MKYFAIILALCMLLGGCAAQQIPESQPINPPGSYGQSQPFTDDATEYPVPPEELPTGENSDAPAPEEGPEGLPTRHYKTEKGADKSQLLFVYFWR